MPQKRSPFSVLQPLDLGEAHWTSGFWADRFHVCSTSMVPTMGQLMQETQRIRFVGNFEVACGIVEGAHRGARWNDGDFYKWLESAASVYVFTRDAALDAEMDRLIDLVGTTQEPDGYIHTDVQIKQRAGHAIDRFGDPMDFEMYNFGHLITAAVVHHRATGKSNLLSIARKAADFLDRIFASPTPRIARHGICPAHLMALVDLHRTTGERRYLELAERLLNMRDLVANGDDDNQDRVPFRQQREAVGHAVRATYLYAGAADIHSENGEQSLVEPLQSIWADLTSHKLQITGGCGALYDGASPDGTPEQHTIRRIHQAFGRNYQLPQSTAHNETCAAIGNLLWNWRMMLITGESRFADVIENSLYNSVLAGISLDGKRFFYTNTLRQLNPMPITLRWNRRREEFPGCFCCPPNVVRTVAQASQYAYAKSDAGISVVLYGANVLDTEFPSGRLRLRQHTAYPWSGNIRLIIEEAPTDLFAFRLRIPSWAKNATVRDNRSKDEIPAEPGRFFEISRKWAPGEWIELNLPMPARMLEADPYVEECRNQVAVQRGPIVYCLESVDLPPGTKLLDVQIPANAVFSEVYEEHLVNMTVLQTSGFVMPSDDRPKQPFLDVRTSTPKQIPLRLIPYFAWDNRGESEMSVWLPLTRLESREGK